MGTVTAVLGAYLGIGVFSSLIGPVHRERAKIVRSYEWNAYAHGSPMWKIRALAASLLVPCVLLWPVLLAESFYRLRRTEAPMKAATETPVPTQSVPVGASLSPDTVLQIGNCAFSFVCSKKWSELREVDASPNVRFCTSCDKNVYVCDSEADFTRRARAGECVAVHVDHTTDSDNEIMGKPAFEDEDGRDL